MYAMNMALSTRRHVHKFFITNFLKLLFSGRQNVLITNLHIWMIKRISSGFVRHSVHRGTSGKHSSHLRGKYIFGGSKTNTCTDLRTWKWMGQVLRYTKMQTVTNLYILNLAIADECFLIGIPFIMTTMGLGYWPFGNVMCKVTQISTSF